MQEHLNDLRAGGRPMTREELAQENKRLQNNWNKLKQYFIDYRFNATGSHEDGRYCVAISVTDLLKKMEELEQLKGGDE